MSQKILAQKMLFKKERTLKKASPYVTPFKALFSHYCRKPHHWALVWASPRYGQQSTDDL